MNYPPQESVSSFIIRAAAEAADASRGEAKSIRDEVIAAIKGCDTDARRKRVLMEIFDDRLVKLRAAAVNWGEVSRAEREYFSGSKYQRVDGDVRVTNPDGIDRLVRTMLDRSKVRILRTGGLSEREALAAVRAVYPEKEVQIDRPEMKPGDHVPGTRVPDYHAGRPESAAFPKGGVPRP